MAKTKEEISEEFNSEVYEHYRNSVSLYMLLRMEAEKVRQEIKINAEQHDPKRMRRDLHDANMVQMFSSYGDLLRNRVMLVPGTIWP